MLQNLLKVYNHTQKQQLRGIYRDATIMDTSYLTTQVVTIIGQLHGLFDEIGVPTHERESRESEVSFRRLDKGCFADVHQSFLQLYRRHCTTNCVLLLRESILAL